MWTHKELSNGGVRSLGQRPWSALSTLDCTRSEASANIPVFGWNTREIPLRSECQMKGPFSLRAELLLCLSLEQLWWGPG